jgi:hypothetical protein
MTAGHIHDDADGEVVMIDLDEIEAAAIRARDETMASELGSGATEGQMAYISLMAPSLTLAFVGAARIVSEIATTGIDVMDAADALRWARAAGQVLSTLEWRGSPEWRSGMVYPTCLMCEALRPDGHAEDCPMGILLTGSDDEEETDD